MQEKVGACGDGRGGGGGQYIQILTFKLRTKWNGFMGMLGKCDCLGIRIERLKEKNIFLNNNRSILCVTLLRRITDRQYVP